MKNTETPAVPHSFYRPHPRAAHQFRNELVNQVTGEITNPPSMTKQSFVAECDINNIIKSFRTTGMLNHISAKAALGAYQDLPSEIDFQQSLNVVIQSEAAFSTLPSSLRSRFSNDPTEFLAYMADPANGEEIVKLGLAVKRPQEPATAPSPAPATTPPKE